MDLEREVSTEEGQKLAEELGVPFIETSAKSGLNIDEIFNDIVERIHKAFGNIKKPTKNISYQAPDKKCCA